MAFHKLFIKVFVRFTIVFLLIRFIALILFKSILNYAYCYHHWKWAIYGWHPISIRSCWNDLQNSNYDKVNVCRLRYLFHEIKWKECKPTILHCGNLVWLLSYRCVIGEDDLLCLWDMFIDLKVILIVHLIM